MNNEVSLARKKSLILTGNTAFESIWKRTLSDDIDIKYAYRGSNNIFTAFVRIMAMKMKIPMNYLWYSKYDFSDYDRIIVFDSFINIEYLEWLRDSIRCETKLVFYYWNKISSRKIDPRKVKEIGYEVWSFDEGDCALYDLKYNPQFYAYSWYKGINVAPTVDVSFVGRDKGERQAEIDSLVEELNFQGISTQMYITARKWYKRFSSKRYQKYLTFDKVIAKELEGRAILDYGVPYQTGYTLRLYDGLCNGRKVITNNKNVVEQPFYSKSNIFVLGMDDISIIKDFISGEFDDESSQILSEYSIEEWCNRFI